MTSLASVMQSQPQRQEDPNPANDPAASQATDPTNIDQNGDGAISSDELFAAFDADGDGKISIVDYAAHILFHILNPTVLKPYMNEAHGALDQYKEKCAHLHNRLKETLLVSKEDPKGNDKVKQALTKGDDVQVMDKDKINQFRLKEHLQNLAGIPVVK